MVLARQLALCDKLGASERLGFGLGAQKFKAQHSVVASCTYTTPEARLGYILRACSEREGGGGEEDRPDHLLPTPKV